MEILPSGWDIRSDLRFSRSYLYKKLLPIILFFIFLVNPLQAESADDLLSLDLESLMAIEVSVATKTAQSLSEATSAVSVISRAELQASGAASIVEALRLVSGINIRWNPMMQTVTIRGFGQNPFSNRVLMLIDGIPYNSWNKGGFPQQPGFDFFNIENVKQIEVIKGPSSSLYGENAYWGVINIVSISGKDLKGARIKAKTGSRQTRELSAQVGDKWANGDWLASVKWLQSEFPTNIWQNTPDAGVQSSEIFLKTNWKSGSLSYYRLEDRVDGFDYPYPSVSPTATYRSSNLLKQRVDIIASEYEHSLSGNAVLTGHISYAKRVGSHCAACHGKPQGDFADDIIDHGYQAFGNVQLELRLADNHMLLMGAEIRRVNTGDHEDELGTHNISSGTGMGIHPNDDLITAYNKHAFYLQNQWRATEKLSVITGIRVDSKTDPDLFSKQTSPRTEALYKFSDDFRVRGAGIVPDITPTSVRCTKTHGLLELKILVSRGKIPFRLRYFLLILA